MTTLVEPLAVLRRRDVQVLRILAAADYTCLTAAALIAATVLGAWVVPAFDSMVPAGWSLMKANTALAILLCTAGLALTRPKERVGLLAAGRVAACMAVLIASMALFEHWSGSRTGFSTLLAADSGSERPGLMSVQSGCFLVLLGFSLLIPRASRGLPGHILDALIAIIVTFLLVLASGYLFGATGLYSQSPGTRTSPQTLVCLGLLVVSLTARRAPYGYFSVLVGEGIGSTIARVAVPGSQALVLLFFLAGQLLLKSGHLTLPYVAALMASGLGALLFLLVVLMSRKISDFEGVLRDMSLTDELTGLHNRRGFYLLGEQAMREARRDGLPLAVCFIDADGLKVVNDTQGHDAGSALLRDVAAVLRSACRRSDVAGRLGGDEFAVVVRGRHTDPTPTLQRLEAAIEAANATGNKPYRVSVSVGTAKTEAGSDETFAELVDRADAAMYEHKRSKRASS